MFLFPHFYYNDNAGEGGGAAAEVTNTENVVDTPAAAIFTPDELKEFGFDNLDQLKENLRRQKQDNVSDEVKAKRQQVEIADFLKFSAENELMKVDDYNQFQTLKGKTDTDLVYSRFATEFKEDDPGATDEDIKTAFEAEYKISSENEKAKARGNGRLLKEAKEIRSPYETSYTTAKSRYDEEVAMRGKLPEYNKFIEKVITDNTPDKLTVFKTKVGEDDIAIDVELNAEDRKELLKLFTNPKTFHAYLKSDGKVDDLSKSVSKKVTGFLKEKYAEKAHLAIWEAGHGVGVKSGSNVGAENLYGTRQGNGKAAPVVDMAMNEKANAARERARSAR